MLDVSFVRNEFVDGDLGLGKVQPSPFIDFQAGHAVFVFSRLK